MAKATTIVLLLCLVGVVFAAEESCKQARVLGAGVVGLLSALQLQKIGFNVTIHAYASPVENSDYAWYASPHAGAWWSGNWNEDSYPSYSALIGMTISEPLSTAITRNAEVFYANAPSSVSELAHQHYADNFRNYTAEELTAKYGSRFNYGYEMTAIIVSAPDYTKFLLNKFLDAGGRIIHQNVSRLSDLTDLPNTDLVINAPGLGALWLGDVEDTTVYPQRGQTLIMRNPAITHISRARSPIDSSDPGRFGTYILPRANGEIVVGGTRTDNDWNTEVNATDTENIRRRATVMNAAIADATVVGHSVGFRPGRTGGIRVEQDNRFKVPVVHHYGHAGGGFEESWGSTFRAIKIVQTIFPDIKACPVKSQLCTDTPAGDQVTSAAGRAEPFYKFW